MTTTHAPDPDRQASPAPSFRSRHRVLAAATGLTALVAGAVVVPLAGATDQTPVSGPGPIVAVGGYSASVVASGQSLGTLLPDDLTTLNGYLFVAYQNGVGATGSPSPTGRTRSSIVEYRLGGPSPQWIARWNVVGKVDGMKADPATGQILASVNEDGNSSFYTIQPANIGIVTHYTYNVNPTSLGGGGTDAIMVQGGTIYISGSSPSAAGAPALYRVSLNGTTHVAFLRPVFDDNAAATGPNGPVTLGLTDPDSNNVVPAVSPLYGGDLMVDSQRDAQLIFVKGAGTPAQTLTQLPVGTQVDDVEWATSTSGTLYVADNSNNDVVAITGKFTPGTAFVSAPNDSGVGTFVGTLNLSTGAIQPVAIGFGNTHGMVFVPSS